MRGVRPAKGLPAEGKAFLFFILMLVFPLFIFCYTNEAERRGAARASQTFAEASDSVQTAPVGENAVIQSEPEAWYEPWVEGLQGGEIGSENLWAIDSHWEALAGSGCPGNLMAALWWRESGNSIISNNPFTLPAHEVDPRPTMEGFAADASRACERLRGTVRNRGNEWPEEITRENVGIILDAVMRYNGLRYGTDWSNSPFVASNLDSGHTRMMKCAVDGCGYEVVDYLDGVFTFWIKLERRS